MPINNQSLIGCRKRNPDDNRFYPHEVPANSSSSEGAHKVRRAESEHSPSFISQRLDRIQL